MPVLVALPVPRLPPLTYADPHEGSTQVGCRVMVPLGKRMVTGTVVKIDVEAVPNMKAVVEVLDEVPAFPPLLMDLTHNISDYYLCSWGETLAAALPSGMSPGSLIRVRITADLPEEALSALHKRAPRRAQLLELIQQYASDVSVDHLQRLMKGAPVTDQLDALQRMGVIEVEHSVEKDAKARTVRAVSISSVLASDETTLREAFNLLDAKAPKQSLTLGHVYLAHRNGTHIVPVSALLQELKITSSVVAGLIAREFLTEHYVPASFADEGFENSLSARDESELDLTKEQQSAVEVLTTSVSSGSFNPYLLHGVTGSGKTIVYQRVIQHALGLGKRALVLVPEIALTPQLSDRFRAVFGSRVGVLHSKLAMGERITLWRAIRHGEIDVVVGARSAVFAPLENVGVIVVDEEHEPSYKQDHPAPRYNGRDVAAIRANLHACTLILGSATPSLETLANVSAGRYTQLSLSTRADGAILPTVEVVDIRRERKDKRMQGAFAFTTVDAITANIAENKGSLVFINRRGYASQLQCLDCGDVPACTQCDVSLTYHKVNATLRCHYCGYSEPLRTSCYVCGSIDLREAGTGTQRVQEDLDEALNRRLGKPARIQRFDADTTGRKGEHRRILREFSRGNIDVLIGTQMIAKGLDLPSVTLVVVVNADLSLHQQDFRASERTVQLLLQVSGRAGRVQESPGRVIIQTSAPTHPAIQTALSGERSPQSLLDWAAEEMLVRKELSYPPFSRFICIEISSLEETAAEDHARILSALIPERSQTHLRLEPVAPSVARIRNRYRRIIIVKNLKATDPSGRDCRALLRSALAEYYATYSSSGVRVTVDIDAQGNV